MVEDERHSKNIKKNEAHKSCTQRTIIDVYQRGKVMAVSELSTTKKPKSVLMILHNYLLG